MFLYDSVLFQGWKEMFGIFLKLQFLY